MDRLITSLQAVGAAGELADVRENVLTALSAAAVLDVLPARVEVWRALYVLVSAVEEHGWRQQGAERADETGVTDG